MTCRGDQNGERTTAVKHVKQWNVLGEHSSLVLFKLIVQMNEFSMTEN